MTKEHVEGNTLTDETPLFSDTLQVALVVRDLEAAMAAFHNDYGIGPWITYNFNPETCTNLMVDEKPQDYSFRLGLAMLGNVQWELIEPLDDKSIYAEFLRNRGEGVHHVAMETPDYESTVNRLRAKGHSALQSGTFGGTTFTYFDTDSGALRLPIELYSGPLPDIAPHGHYPPQGH